MMLKVLYVWYGKYTVVISVNTKVIRFVENSIKLKEAISKTYWQKYIKPLIICKTHNSRILRFQQWEQWDVYPTRNNH